MSNNLSANKFGIKKEFIEITDLEKVIEKMKVKISAEDVHNILLQLDVNNTGKVSVSNLIEHITKKNE